MHNAQWNISSRLKRNYKQCISIEIMRKFRTNEMLLCEEKKYRIYLYSLLLDYDENTFGYRYSVRII